MLFIKKIICFFGLAFILISCSSENPLGNLFPDGIDRRNENLNSGLQPGNSVPDITLYKTDNTTQTTSNLLVTKKGVVLYFTMWCPVCETHMDYIRLQIMPQHPDVEFYIIDYVSATITDANNNQTAGGYSSMNVALDKNNYLKNLFYGTMGTTIVIDKTSTLQLNEDFKDGQRLIQSLNALP